MTLKELALTRESCRSYKEAVVSHEEQPAFLPRPAIHSPGASLQQKAKRRKK